MNAKVEDKEKREAREKKIERTHGFQYHAHATGVAGHFYHPFKDVIEVQAPSALPITGGYSRGRVENYRYKEILSFRAAYTQVSGGYSEDTDSWDTVMTTAIENLDILGMVTADLVQGRLASRQVVGEAEPSILPLGTRFEGLRIAGHPVRVELNTGLYCKFDTHSKLTDAYKNDPHFKRDFDIAHRVGKEDDLPHTHKHFFPWGRNKPTEEIPHSGGLIASTLVKALHYDTDAFNHHGHVIHLPQFGTIILGQLLIGRTGRRLTMVQVDLGCSISGVVTCGTGEGSGSPMPPPRTPIGK